MNIEHFLAFWNQNNALIIEVLIGVVILLVAVLGFVFISSDEGDGDDGLPAKQLEQLESVLKNFQNAGGTVSATPGGESLGAVSDDGKKLIAEKDQQIKTLQAEVEKLAAAPAVAAAAAAASENNGSKELEKKIKDLEERLSEYEIISEDIADLSKFRAENQQLRGEITKLKGGAADASAESDEPMVGALPPEPAAVATETAPVDDPLAVTAEELKNIPQESVEATPAEQQDSVEAALSAAITNAIAPEAAVPAAEVVAEAPAVTPAPEAAASATPPAAAPENDSSIDDDLMKEFAAAVEQQKSAEADPAKPGEPEELKDREELMGQFEKFVNKGS